MLQYRRAYQIGRDRRPASRRKVCLQGKFQCRGSYEWIDCEVINISPFGAELRVKQPMIVSRAVRLQILGDFFDATGDVRHQNGRTFGIEFTSSRLEALARYS